jgi:cysteine desulfurase/selenocysteine lyase
LDNAATSWPKPESVLQEITASIREYGANPGRGGHRMAIRASEKVYECRQNLADLFGITDPLQIVFTSNATESLNIGLKGWLRPGDHVITTSLEHNAVARTLFSLSRSSIQWTPITCAADGSLDVSDIQNAIKKNTRMICTLHASNVTGTIMPIREIGRVAREAGIVFMVDSAQTAGDIPIDVAEDHIDILAFTGHKGLLGPQGIGGLYIRPVIDLNPLKEGGTGSLSESFWQPDFLPDRYESGTLNTPGIAGLNEGVKYILQTGINNIRSHEKQLTAYMLHGLQEIKNVKVYGTDDPDQRTGVLSITIKGKDCNEVCCELDEKYEIAVRGGIHCAPLAHKIIGTASIGTIRFSIGVFNTMQDIDSALKAVQTIASM